MGGGENDYFIVPADAKVSNDNFLIIISTERTDDIYFQLEELVFGELKPENRAIPGLNRNTKFTGSGVPADLSLIWSEYCLQVSYDVISFDYQLFKMPIF